MENKSRMEYIEWLQPCCSEFELFVHCSRFFARFAIALAPEQTTIRGGVVRLIKALGFNKKPYLSKNNIVAVCLQPTFLTTLWV